MKPIIMAVVAVSLSAAFAETYHWTGAAGDSDGVYQWNNSDNWDQGSRGSGTHAVPDAGATVVFGAVSGNPESMVLDLTGMNPVGQFRVEGATAPAYQFGTSIGTSQTVDDGQGFWIDNGSAVTIADDVMRDQRIMRLAYHATGTKTCALTNKSVHASLIYDSIAHDTTSSPKEMTVYHSGVGRVVTYERQFHTSGGQTMYFYGTGPVIWRNAMSAASSAPRPIYVSETGSAPRDFEIAQGGKLYASNGSSPFTGKFDVKVDTWVHGEGIVAANTHSNSKTGNGNEAIRGMGLLVSGSNGKTLTVDVPLMPWNTHQAQNKWWDGYIPLIGCAKSVISLNSSNGCSRAARLYGQVRVNAKLIGNADCTAEETSLGPGEIVMSAYFDVSNSKFRLYYPLGCTLAYSGETATETDRDILLTNAIYEVAASGFPSYANSSVATGTVANAGGGLLKLTGQVRALNPDAALVLQPETAPIEFAGSFAAAPAVALVVRGAEEVRMASVPANASELSLMGGTLRLTDDAPATAVPLAAYGAGNRIVVEGSALTLTGTTPAALVANGAVDFSFERSTVVTFAGVTSATEVPENLTVNGVGALFTDDGRLVERASYWKEATDGTWSEAAKWDAGVPSGNRDARITIGGADYTVTVDETPTAPDVIHLGQGDTGYTSTLAVAVAMPAGVRYDVGAGGVLNVTDGGVLALEEGGASVDLARGGTLRVDGTGRCLYDDSVDNTFGTGTRQFVGDGALVRIGTDSPSVYVQPDGAGETSELVLDNRGSGSAGSTNDFGNGNLYIGNCAGGTGVLTVHGKDDTNKSVNRVSLDRGDPYMLDIGYRAGTGVLNIDSGCLQVRNSGLFVPGVAYSDKTPTIVSGVANQTGGYVSLCAYSATANRQLSGLSVGCGDYFYRRYVTEDQVSVDGVYNLSGGTLDVKIGYAVIGAGSGTGVMHQTGGTFLHQGSTTSSSATNQLFAAEPDANKARTFHFPMIIGFQGGKGTYEISGGTATVGSKTALIPALYIGTGYNHEEFPWGFRGNENYKPQEAYFDFERDGAEGLLRVSGGTFTCTTNVVLGAALGTGTIEMVGTNGTLSVGRLVATNGVKSVLRFVCDRENPAAGVSPITVADKAMLDGTTLEVELGENYSGRARVRLINAPQVEGDFGRVTVTGKSAESAVVVKDELGVRLQIRRGFMMTVR